MKQHDFKPIDAQSMTGTATITGTASNIAGMQGCSYQHVWTGTPTGSFSFETSNNWDNIRQTGDWTAIPASAFAPSVTNPTGAAGTSFVDLASIAARWIRPKYTNVSGSGTLTTYFASKGPR